MKLRAFFIRTSRLGRLLLLAAAACIGVAGLLLALGHPRAHTLTAYAAVALAALGVILALPAALFEKDTLR
jgi:hypothetical protein